MVGFDRFDNMTEAELGMDSGSKELGFSQSTNVTRARDTMVDMESLPSVELLSKLHDAERPLSRIFLSKNESKPSRHAPWKSQAERILMAGEIALGNSAIRVLPRAGPNAPFNRSANFPTRGGVGSKDLSLPGTAAMMYGTPNRVGRPGTSDSYSMRNRRLYSGLADVLRDVDMHSAASLASRSKHNQSAGLIKGGGAWGQPGQRRQDPRPQNLGAGGEVLVVGGGGGGEQGIGGDDDDSTVNTSATTAAELMREADLSSRPQSSPRSPYARFDLIPQQFSNAVVQDLWQEVHKNAVSTTPSRSDEYLSEEGLPRRLPSNVSALESPLRGVTPSPGSLHRFHSETLSAASVRSKAEGQARGMVPDEFHPTFYSTDRYHLKERPPPTVDPVTGLEERPSTTLTTYRSSYGHTASTAKKMVTDQPPRRSSGSVWFDREQQKSPQQNSPASLVTFEGEAASPSEPDDNASTSSTQRSSGYGARSTVHNFFSGPRATTNGSQNRTDGRTQVHSHFSDDARFHAQKYFQVTHVDPNYSGLRTPSHFFRISPSNAKIGPPMRDY